MTFEEFYEKYAQSISMYQMSLRAKNTANPTVKQIAALIYYLKDGRSLDMYMSQWSKNYNGYRDAFIKTYKGRVLTELAKVQASPPTVKDGVKTGYLLPKPSFAPRTDELLLNNDSSGSNNKKPLKIPWPITTGNRAADIGIISVVGLATIFGVTKLVKRIRS